MFMIWKSLLTLSWPILNIFPSQCLSELQINKWKTNEKNIVKLLKKNYILQMQLVNKNKNTVTSVQMRNFAKKVQERPTLHSMPWCNQFCGMSGHDFKIDHPTCIFLKNAGLLCV